MQKTQLPTNQLIQDQGAVGSLPQQVIQFFQTRIETEEAYSKALLKLNNKFPNIQTHPTASSKVLKHLKAIHSEKYHQTIQFIAQLKEQKNNFQNLIAKSNQELQKSASQARANELNLKNVLQKIAKLHAKGQQEIKNMDQKFLLKELQLISADYKTKKMEDSLKILDQEGKVCENLKKEYELLKTEGQKFIKKIKKYEKIVFETSPEIEKEIIELVKRYTVQEVSLIRNLQYDIDNMIKKTNIFDEAPPAVDEKAAKPPKNSVVKAAKQIFKEEFKIKDIFEEVKKLIASTTFPTLKELESKKNADPQKNPLFIQILQKWNDQKNTTQLIAKLNDNYSQYKQPAQTFFEHFRGKNINKFPAKQFIQLQKLFNLLLSKSYEQKDFQSIQKLIVYGSCYVCLDENKDKAGINTMMDSIKKQQYLADICFWRFLLYFAIQRSVLECLSIQNQKQMHLKNNVFSTLVSNSLNLIGCGVDKYVAKNNVAKMAKAFGLVDNQVGDLLKFIETGYEKYEKQKGKK